MAGAICIDFGSAYTKVAIRPSDESKGRLVLDLPSAQQDRELGMGFCVPTVVAERRRSGRIDYTYGDAAASVVPGDIVEVYRNWKPKLLTNPAGETAKGSSWRDVGVEFFRRLHTDVAARLKDYGGRVKGWDVRVCIPRVEGLDDHRARQAVSDVLTASGWTEGSSSATTSPVVYEPVANTWGIITEGVNHPGIDGARYHLSRMVQGSRVQRTFQQAHRRGQADFRFPILVVDVGAYTTDCGLLNVDWSFIDNDELDVVHRSYEMGVKELDADIVAHASDEEQAAIASQNTHTWEAVKPRLYQGGEAKLTWMDAGIRRMTTVDGSGNAKLIRGFAKKIVTCVKRFADAHMGDLVAQEVILTGGGMRIQEVSATLLEAVEKKQIPARTVTTPKPDDHLVRGATAIGGVSLLVD